MKQRHRIQLYVKQFCTIHNADSNQSKSHSASVFTQHMWDLIFLQQGVLFPCSDDNKHLPRY